MMIKKQSFHLFPLLLLTISVLTYSNDSTTVDTLTANDSIANDVAELNSTDTLESADLIQTPVDTITKADSLTDTLAVSTPISVEDSAVSEVKKESASNAFDSSIEPDEKAVTENVAVKSKQQKNPHSKGTGFIIPGLVLPAVSGVLWGGSYLLEIQAGKNWISQKERTILNSMQITSTVLGSAGVTLLTIGIVKRAKRNKWDEENKLIVIPTIDIENSGAGIYMSLKF